MSETQAAADTDKRAVSDRVWRIGLAAVAILYVVIRLPLLGIPVVRDEGLFGVAAQAILRGETLYRDVFDLKPPGIFYIYALALKHRPPGAAAPARPLIATLLPRELADETSGARAAAAALQPKSLTAAEQPRAHILQEEIRRPALAAPRPAAPHLLRRSVRPRMEDPQQPVVRAAGSEEARQGRLPALRTDCNQGPPRMDAGQTAGHRSCGAQALARRTAALGGRSHRPGRRRRR